MNGSDVEDYIRNYCMYEAIYDDSEGRKVVVMTGADITEMINNLLQKEREKYINPIFSTTEEVNGDQRIC